MTASPVTEEPPSGGVSTSELQVQLLKRGNQIFWKFNLKLKHKKWRQILYPPTKRIKSQLSLQERADSLSSVDMHNKNSLLWSRKQGKAQASFLFGSCLLSGRSFPEHSSRPFPFLITKSDAIYPNPVPDVSALGNQPCLGTPHSCLVSTPTHRDYLNISSIIFPAVQVKWEEVHIPLLLLKQLLLVSFVTSDSYVSIWRFLLRIRPK